jgi:hypothetical protein
MTHLRAFAGARGHLRVWEEWAEVGDVMEAGLGHAAARLPRGRARNPHALLARNLANILAATGECLDARPNGALCRVLGVVLDAAGEQPSNIPSIARPEIRRRAAEKSRQV